MGRRDKLIKQILKEKSITYEEAEKVLIFIGYAPVAPKSGSSHIAFRKSGIEKITLVRTQKPIKPYAIKMIKEALIIEGYNEK